MVQEVKCVLARQAVTYSDDVNVLGGVGELATIEIEGNLTIVGDVGRGVTINLFHENAARRQLSPEEKRELMDKFHAQGIMINADNVTVSNDSPAVRTLIIQGNVGEGVVINGHSANITVEGSIDNFTKLIIKSGDMVVADVGWKVALRSNKGRVMVKTLGQGSGVWCNSGSVVVETTGENVMVNVNSGKVAVGVLNKSGKINCNVGDVTVNTMGENTRAMVSQGDVSVTSLTPSTSIMTTRGVITLPSDSPFLGNIRKTCDGQSLNAETVGLSMTKVTFTMSYTNRQSSKQPLIETTQTEQEKPRCCNIL